jgi:hypothetical protein
MAKLVRGPGIWASLAARVRTQGDYSVAAGLERMLGERRTWDAQGRTYHLVTGSCIADVDNRVSEVRGWYG